jgi:RNA polymerase sigma factor (sigma-70 family)
MADHRRVTPTSLEPDQARSQVSTRTLVERTRLGDAAAGNRLFDRIVKRVRRWASGRLPRRARDLNDTVDVLQDAAAGLWGHLDHVRIEKPGDLEAYVKQAVRNRVYNEARRVNARPGPADLDSQLPDLGPTPLARLLSQETSTKFRAAFDQLTNEERELLLARHEYGYSYDDVAALLKKPSAAAARMAVNRAKARLSGLMRNDGD